MNHVTSPVAPQLMFIWFRRVGCIILRENIIGGGNFRYNSLEELPNKVKGSMKTYSWLIIMFREVNYIKV